MDEYKPLRLTVFSFDVLRLLFLAGVLAFSSAIEAIAKGGFFPYAAYLSSNALFPLIGFFLFLNLAGYRNYLPLYMAGKTIAVVLFYIWAVFTLPFETGFMTRESYIEGMVLLGGSFFISLGDMLSVFGIWVINKKFSRIETAQSGTNGGL